MSIISLSVNDRTAEMILFYHFRDEYNCKNGNNRILLIGKNDYPSCITSAYVMVNVINLVIIYNGYQVW